MINSDSNKYLYENNLTPLMKINPVFKNETDRLRTQHKYDDLGKLPELNVDDVCRIACAICQTPFSLAGIIDRNGKWLKPIGLPDGPEIYGVMSLCKKDGIQITPDLSEYASDQIIASVIEKLNVAFYVAIDLQNAEGDNAGILCLMDTSPDSCKPGRLMH